MWWIQIFFNIIKPIVSHQENEMLMEIPDEVEVKNTLVEMKATSSPGPDGFTALFFFKNAGILRAQMW